MVKVCAYSCHQWQGTDGFSDFGEFFQFPTQPVPLSQTDSLSEKSNTTHITASQIFITLVFLHLINFTCRQLCLFLHRQNFQTSDLSNQHSGQHQNFKSIRSCSTVPTNSLIRTRYPLGFSKCASVLIPTITNIVKFSQFWFFSSHS